MSGPLTTGRLLAPRSLFFGLCAVALVYAVAVPFVNQPYIVQDYTLILLVALTATGLSLLTGFGGVTSIGHSAIFGLGAYATAILCADHNWQWWAALPVSVLLALAAGALIGIPALRIKGLYLAILTMGIAVLFPSLILKYGGLTGGDLGLPLPTMEPPAWTGLATDQFGYLVCLVALVLGMVLARNVARGRTGLALIAMRDNETAAIAMGVSIRRAKITVFALSACFAGVAGSLFAATQGIVSSSNSYVTLTGSIEFLAAMVIGGSTTVLGPVIGAAIAERVPVMLSSSNAQLAPFIYGAILIIVMLVMRDGIAGAVARLVQHRLAKHGPGGPGAGGQPAPRQKHGQRQRPTAANTAQLTVTR